MSDQSELIERYLLACRQNPNAPAPPELDADMAAFIRHLAQKSDTPDAAVRHRVWQKAWRNAKQVVRHNLETAETPTVIRTSFYTPSKARITGALAFVATLLLIFVVMFTAWRTLQFASQPTATPTVVPTSTSFPTVPPPGFIIEVPTPVP